MEFKYSNRFNSFCKSLDNLKVSINADKTEFFVLPATIQNYNLTMDLARICGLTDSLLFYEACRYNIKKKQFLATRNKYYVCDIGITNT